VTSSANGQAGAGTSSLGSISQLLSPRGSGAGSSVARSGRRLERPVRADSGAGAVRAVGQSAFGSPVFQRRALFTVTDSSILSVTPR